MSPLQTGSRALALVALLGATLAVAGCSGNRSYPDVSVATPEVRGSGPALSMAEWRRRVGAICRHAAAEATQVSSRLAEKVSARTDVGKVSRLAFMEGKPVVERQLEALARLRPPEGVAAGYQDFVTTLAEELRWTGRIALLAGAPDADDALREADSQLAARAAEASSFAGRYGLSDCLADGDQRG